MEVLSIDPDAVFEDAGIMIENAIRPVVYFVND